MRSLYVKFVAMTIGIMLLSSLLAFMFANFYYQQKLKPMNDEKNSEIALEIASFAEALDHISLDRYLENIASVGYQIMLLTEDGQESFYGDPFRETELPDPTKRLVLNGEVYHGILQFPQETFVTGFFANELINTIGVPIHSQNEKQAIFIRPNIKLLFNEMHFLFAWLLALTVILSVVLVWISTRLLIQPIDKLTDATKKIADGDFSPKLDIEREDEIGELAQHFTKMAEQLDKVDEMKNEFIGNISHDIQTPLTNIKGYTKLLEKNGISSKNKAQYISVIQREIHRLSSLTKQLLLLASLHREEEFVERDSYELSKQLREVIFNYQWILDKQEIMVSYTLPEIFVQGDASLLYNVWENLLTNAIKYNERGGQIDISVKEHKQNIEITFQDSGIGLAPHEQEQIFKRFYRIDSARIRDVEGTGLGLAIVFSIVKLHGGRLDVESEKGIGSTFTVTLPTL